MRNYESLKNLTRFTVTQLITLTWVILLHSYTHGRDTTDKFKRIILLLTWQYKYHEVFGIFLSMNHTTRVQTNLLLLLLN